MEENYNDQLKATLIEKEVFTPTDEELNYGLDEIEKIDESELIENQITEESKELTEEQQREFRIKQLKDMKLTYHPKKLFSAEYRKKRQHKNKAQKNSRKANRK
jgi:maltodextrin utilization protein YvdJ